MDTTIVFLLECPGYTRLQTPITIAGVLNCCHLHANYREGNRMEGKMPGKLKDCERTRHNAMYFFDVQLDANDIQRFICNPTPWC